MGYGKPGCGAYCRVLFPGTYDQLIAAYKVMKAAGLSEPDAVALADDGGRLAAALYQANFGIVAGIAAGLVTAGCARCAVDSAYEDGRPGPPVPRPPREPGDHGPRR